MASAGTVTVDFAAETAKFTSELRKVNQSVQGVDDRLKKLDAVANVARNAFKALAGALAVDRLLGFATAALEMGDAIDKASKKAGVSAEAFSELNFAAKLSAVSTQDLSTSFRFFQNELAKGGDKIKSLGIDLEAFRAQQPDRQFEVLAEAIASIQDPATRAGAAIQVFGDSGSKLLPLFEDGARGIRAAREEAQRLGITLSTDQANALAKAGDDIERVRSAFQSLSATLLSNLAPSLSFVAEKLREVFRVPDANTKELEELQDQFDDTVKRRQALIQEVQQLTQRKASTFVPGLDAEFDQAIAEAQQQIRVTESLLDLLNGRIKQAGDKIEQARVQAEAPVTGFDPSARTFGDPAAAAEQERAKLQLQVQSQIDRDNQTLAEQLEQLRERDFENFVSVEGRKTSAAIAEGQRRLEADAAARNFSIAFAEEQARQEIALKEQATAAGIGALNLLAQSNKKFARLAKAANIVQAIRNTYEGVTNQLRSGDPYSAIPRAAAVLAFGLAQVAAIRKTPEIGDVGGSASIGGGGATIGNQNTTLPFAQQQTPQQPIQQLQPPVTQIVFNGPVMGMEEVIVEAIRKATDNDVIVINQRSAQAQMFQPAT